MDRKATWHLHGLSGLQETRSGNVLHPMINHNQQNLYMGRISQNTCIYENLPPQGNIFLTKKKRSVLHYYKNPKPSESKVRIISPSFGTLELWIFTNWTFGRYLVDTTPVLSVGFFLFSLFCRFCLEHIRIVQFIDEFQHHQSHTNFKR